MDSPNNLARLPRPYNYIVVSITLFDVFKYTLPVSTSRRTKGIFNYQFFSFFLLACHLVFYE